jgi:regulator of RNase E activity RraB
MQYFRTNGGKMGILDLFRPKSKPFVTEASFQANLKKQAAANSQVLGVLKHHALSDTNLRCLEFFFYTNTIEKARSLAAELRKKEYSVTYREAGYPRNQFVITGWTRKMSIEDNALAAWAKEMCELGYEYDCEFDGWGTDIDQ